MYWISLIYSIGSKISEESSGCVKGRHGGETFPKKSTFWRLGLVLLRYNMYSLRSSDLSPLISAERQSEGRQDNTYLQVQSQPASAVVALTNNVVNGITTESKCVSG